MVLLPLSLWSLISRNRNRSAGRRRATWKQAHPDLPTGTRPHRHSAHGPSDRLAREVQPLAGLGLAVLPHEGLECLDQFRAERRSLGLVLGHLMFHETRKRLASSCKTKVASP